AGDAELEAPATDRRAAERGASSSKVLFAFNGALRACEGLQRACDVAQAMDAELHVLQVLQVRPPIEPLAPLFELLDARRAPEAQVSAAFDTESRARIRVRTGLFVKQVASHAVALRASLIMVSPRKRGLGTIVTVLARTANIPVLVLRETTLQKTIVAATDLEDLDYPVLRKAAEIAEQLRCRVIPFHNVTPLSMNIEPETPWPSMTMTMTSGIESENRQMRLARASRRLHIDAPSVTASELSPADGILQIARANDADIVVVGARPRSLLGYLVANGVAAQVVDRARRSVLVTPLDKSEAASA
ncbi:MAG TPA: universal stress protein, partial [Polyangiales bacterium]|nr:universal stress protein [Polyangiales bacterium]